MLEKEWSVSSFSKLQTCIQINKNIKVKKKHFIFIIQNSNKNKKHILKKKKSVYAVYIFSTKCLHNATQ